MKMKGITQEEKWKLPRFSGLSRALMNGKIRTANMALGRLKTGEFEIFYPVGIWGRTSLSRTLVIPLGPYNMDFAAHPHKIK